MSACKVMNGVISGIVGGIVFTFFLVKGGMLPTLGQVIGMPTVPAGLFVHLVTSVVFGALFAIVLGRWLNNYASGLIVGAICGIALWIVGPLTLLPYLANHTALFSLWNPAAIKPLMPALVGHIVFGLVTGGVFVLLNKKACKNKN